MSDLEDQRGKGEVYAEDLMAPDEEAPGKAAREPASSPNEPADDRVPLALVVCGILRDEVEAIRRQQKLGVPVFYLGAAPCVNQNGLRRQLIRQLGRAAAVAHRIVVVIGRCHPQIDEILAQYNAKRLPMNDCFDALLGKERKRLSLEMNTFFTTPTWLRHWRRVFEKGLNWEVEDARQNIGYNERVLLLDPGLRTVSDEEILAFFDYTQVLVEPLRVSLAILTRLILDEVERSA